MTRLDEGLERRCIPQSLRPFWGHQPADPATMSSIWGQLVDKPDMLAQITKSGWQFRTRASTVPPPRLNVGETPDLNLVQG